MSRHAVCATEELPPGERQIVTVENVEVGVFNVEGEFYALLNSCPHQHGPVCEGEVSRDITGEFLEPGTHVEQQYVEDSYTVVCPFHKWSFDIETGEHSGDPDISVPTYDVVVEDETVYVEY